MTSPTNLCLSLSGGGVRAMAYHAGVLRYLAERNAMEQVSDISTVSGGSLLVGLIMKESDYIWPSSNDYLHRIHAAVRQQLCESSLISSSLRTLIKPKNWQYFFSRANVVSQTISELWQITEPISALPKFPVWSINGTTAETGRRFRFKKDTCGDYRLGYATSDSFSLSDAMAMSAAFPGGIGPLLLKTKSYQWKKLPNWNSPPGSEVSIAPPYKKLHIYDGGVYDNLGTEPFFDPGAGKPKKPNIRLLVSDAGSPMIQQFGFGPLNPLRLMRINEITMDQARSLRVRSLMNYFRSDKGLGCYLMLGQHPTEFFDTEYSEKKSWLNINETKQAASYGTSLGKMRATDFDRLEQHGYESAYAVDQIRHLIT